jgi:hypothetical protein
MSEYVNFCGICGVALTQHEIAGVVSGQYINYEMHDNGSLEIVMCTDCQNKVIQIVNEGIDKAISRRLSLDGQEPRGFTKKVRQKWRDERDKDSGSGGEIPIVPPS